MAKFSWLSSLASLTYLCAITSGQPWVGGLSADVVNKVVPPPTLPEMVEPGVSDGTFHLIFRTLVKDILYSTIKSGNLIF